MSAKKIILEAYQGMVERIRQQIIDDKDEIIATANGDGFYDLQGLAEELRSLTLLKELLPDDAPGSVNLPSLMSEFVQMIKTRNFTRAQQILVQFGIPVGLAEPATAYARDLLLFNPSAAEAFLMLETTTSRRTFSEGLQKLFGLPPYVAITIFRNPQGSNQ